MQWDPKFNNNFYKNAIQFQYNDTNISEFLKGVSDISEAYINQALQTLYSDVIDLRTAVGGGLDMWGKRLKFTRYIPTDDETPKDYINFNFYDSYFNKMNFYDKNTKYIGLPDFNYRIILLLLLAQQSVTPNIKAIDTLVNEVFKKLNISIIVKDTTDMSYVTYIFKKEIPEWLGWIFKNYDVFPRPAGVGASFIVDLAKPFSFDRESPELNKEITNFYYGIFTDKVNNNSDFEENLKPAIKALIRNFTSLATSKKSEEELKKSANTLNDMFENFKELVKRLSKFDFSAAVNYIQILGNFTTTYAGGIIDTFIKNPEIDLTGDNIKPDPQNPPSPLPDPTPTPDNPTPTPPPPSPPMPTPGVDWDKDPSNPESPSSPYYIRPDFRALIDKISDIMNKPEYSAGEDGSEPVLSDEDADALEKAMIEISEWSKKHSKDLKDAEKGTIKTLPDYNIFLLPHGLKRVVLQPDGTIDMV